MQELWDLLALETLPFWGKPLWFAAIFAILVLAGMVKGIAGLGMPLVGMPLLALMIELKSAIQLMSVNSLIANFGQMNAGGNIRESWRRYGWFCILTATFTFVGAFAMTKLPTGVSQLVCGIMLMVAAANFFWKIRLSLPEAAARIVAPIAGVLAGLMGGMTAIAGPIVIFYLSLVEHEKDRFIAAISLIYLFSSAAILGSQIAVSGMDLPWIIAAASAIIPVQIGILLGNKVRDLLSQDFFRRMLAVFICGMGVTYILRAVG